MHAYTPNFLWFYPNAVQFMHSLRILLISLDLDYPCIQISSSREWAHKSTTYKRKASIPLTHMHTCEHLFTLKPHPPKTHIIHATVSMVIAYTPWNVVFLHRRISSHSSLLFSLSLSNGLFRLLSFLWPAATINVLINGQDELEQIKLLCTYINVSV